MSEVLLDRPWAILLGLAAAAWLLRRPAGRTAAGWTRAAAILLAAAAAAGPRTESATTVPARTIHVFAGAPAEAPAPAGAAPEDFVRAADLPTALASALARRRAGEPLRLRVACGVPADRTEEGPAAAALRAAVATGVAVHLEAPWPAPLPPAPPPPPWIEGVAVPPSALAGEPLLLHPVFGAAAAADAVAELTVDGAPAGSAGRGAAFPPRTLAPGPHLLAAEAFDRDGASRGASFATITLPGPPAILVLEEGAEPSPLARALAARDLAVTRRAPGPVPGGYGPWAVVVLGRGALGEAALEEAVRRGTGLLVTGAPKDGDGLGRLRGTRMERALPVFLPPPPPERLPPPPVEDRPPPPGKDPSVKIREGERPGAVVTLLLVVDASGSMQGEKIEMARRAAVAAAATLAPEDRFGLLSFTATPRWEIPPGPAGDVERLVATLGRLRAGGGTELLPALQEARRALRREATAVRHCIVLSDGETSPFGIRQAVEGMVAEGATLSTVGIGLDFDVRLMGNLATWGRGRTFPAVDPSSLPRVVTLDTRELLASSEATKARGRPTDLPPPPRKDAPPAPEPPKPPPPPARAALEEADPCALLEGLGPWPAAVPPEAAPEARLATTLALRFAGEGGPALVLGRHGLGRTAVLAWDPADHVAWDGFTAFAARLARGLAAAGGGPAASVESVTPGREGSRVVLALAGPAGESAAAPRVEALHPAGDSPASLPVERAGPRRFAVVLPPGPPGPRVLVLRSADGSATPLGCHDPGPPPAIPDAGYAARVAAAAGLPLGGPLPPAPAAGPGPPVSRGREGALLVAAALLLLAEALLRRRAGELDRAAGAR